jgi:hypothetical protein
MLGRVTQKPHGKCDFALPTWVLGHMTIPMASHVQHFTHNFVNKFRTILDIFMDLDMMK